LPGETPAVVAPAARAARRPWLVPVELLCIHQYWSKVLGMHMLRRPAGR
jgi:hypothetical protein